MGTTGQTRWRVQFTDERGEQTMLATSVELDEDIWVFWRGKEAFLRVPADTVLRADRVPEPDA